MNYYNRNYINRLRRNAHSPENSSDEWAFFFLYIKYTSVVTQIAIKSVVKTVIFYLSQSKCTVSALFLHGFKGCNGYSDLQNTTKGAETIGQKITMLCTKMKKIQKNAVRFDNPKQDFLDDKKYSGTAEATPFGLLARKVAKMDHEAAMCGRFPSSSTRNR